MTDIDMDGLVPNPFPTIEAGDDARALMAQLNRALTTAETALYKADTLVAVLNDTDEFRGEWLPWNQGRNLRMRVQQAIDAVVTAQTMHAPYPKTTGKKLRAVPKPQDAEAQDRLLTRLEVAERYGCSVRTVIRMDEQGEGPKPMRIGPRMIRYRESEVESYLGATAKAAAQ